MIQLASVLQAVISQQLIPTMDGTLIPVFEIMEVTPAIRNMIRENKVHQIDGLIYSSTGSGMISMDQSLINLYKEGQISRTSPRKRKKIPYLRFIKSPNYNTLFMQF